MNNGNEIPAGIRRIVSERTGIVTFEAMAGVIRGNKIRKQFGQTKYGTELETLAAAKRWLGEKRGEIKRDGSAVLSISDHDRVAYAEALRRLEPYNRTILQAVNAAIELWKQEVSFKRIIFSEAAKAFLKHKQLENCRPSYLKDIETRMNALSEFDSRQLSEISAEELVEFMQDREMGEVSWNNWRRNLRVFFTWCQVQEWVRKNPALGIPEKKVDEEEVDILSLDEARKLLKTTMESYRRQVPWLVLGMFAGMRRSEAQAAQWEDIDWEQNVIKVRSAKLRSVSTRYVELTPPARAFLEIFKQDSGPINSGIYARRNELKEISEKTGIDCSRNIYRHSFGSYHLAAHRNRHATMDQMGHENLQTFVRFYRRPIPKLLAEAYWLLSPQSFHHPQHSS
jgi:integrase